MRNIFIITKLKSKIILSEQLFDLQICEKFCQQLCQKFCEKSGEKFCDKFRKNFCKKFCEKFCKKFCHFARNFAKNFARNFERSFARMEGLWIYWVWFFQFYVWGSRKRTSLLFKSNISVLIQPFYCIKWCIFQMKFFKRLFITKRLFVWSILDWTPSFFWLWEYCHLIFCFLMIFS